MRGLLKTTFQKFNRSWVYHSLLALGMSMSMAGNANAVPIFSNTPVVSAVTHSATFDSLTSNGINLNGYTEDGILVDVNDTSWQGFNAFNGGSPTGFYYGNGGNTSFVTISLVSGGVITALDFLLGDGYGLETTTNLIWETFSGAASTGFGDVILGKGSTVGIEDVAGFTSIRLAANAPGINSFGEYQAIAIDDVRIATAPVPEPSTMLLLGSGLVGLIGYRMKKART